MFNKNWLAVLLCAVLASCANTNVISHWQDAENKITYKHPMIIGVSDSQQTRRLYEKYFVSQLKKHHVDAIPSYTLIDSKHIITRDIVLNAIKDTDIDAVLVSYLVSAESEVVDRNDSPFNTGYSGSADDNQISATIISNRGRSNDKEVFVLKNDLFDVRKKALIWSVQTKTVAPESIDKVITDVVELLIKEMSADGVF